MSILAFGDSEGPVGDEPMLRLFWRTFGGKSVVVDPSNPNVAYVLASGPAPALSQSLLQWARQRNHRALNVSIPNLRAAWHAMGAMGRVKGRIGFEVHASDRAMPGMATLPVALGDADSDIAARAASSALSLVLGFAGCVAIAVLAKKWNKS